MSLIRRGAEPLNSTLPHGFLSKAAIIELETALASAGAAPLIDQKPSRKAYGDWGYELRLGESYRSLSKKHSAQPEEVITIEPGEFALLLTEERLNLPPDLAAFITMRLRHKLKGLVNVSGFHVNPGYSGRLLFSVYNAAPGPVTLRHGDPMFMIVFSRLDRPVENSTAGTKIESIAPEHIDTLHGPSVSLVSLGERVQKLEGQLKFWRGLVIALLTALAVAVAKGGVNVSG